MGNRRGTRYGKFFRRLIATSQPADIPKIIERYEKDLKRTEEGYHDIIIHSGGAISYQDIMVMPLTSISIFVERLNKINQDKADAMAKARTKR